MLYLAIPAHNEAATIGVLLWRLRTVLAEFPREYEVVVYDDASSDLTPDVLEPYTKVLPLTVLRGDKPIGYAGAVDALVRHVSRQTRYPRRDAMLLLQADFTDPPALIPEFAKRFEGGADMVIGERSRPLDTPQPVRRLLGVAPWLMRPFVRVEGVRDLTSTFRLVRISVLRDLVRASGDAPVCIGDELTANTDFLLRTVPLARRVETLSIDPTFAVRTRDTRRVAVRDGLALVRWAWRARGRKAAPSTAPESASDANRASRGDARPESRHESRTETRAESRSDVRSETRSDVRPDGRADVRNDVRKEPRIELTKDARGEGRSDPRKEARGERTRDPKREGGNDARNEGRTKQPREAGSEERGEKGRRKKKRPSREERAARAEQSSRPEPRAESALATEGDDELRTPLTGDVAATVVVDTDTHSMRPAGDTDEGDANGEVETSDTTESERPKRSPRKKRRKRGSRRDRLGEARGTEGGDLLADGLDAPVAESSASGENSAGTPNATRKRSRDRQESRDDRGDAGGGASLEASLAGDDDSGPIADDASGEGSGDESAGNAGVRARRRGRRGRRGGARRGGREGSADGGNAGGEANGANRTHEGPRGDDAAPGGHGGNSGTPASGSD